MNLEEIALAGGCFWCTHGVFDELRGVLQVESGYSNGQDSPTPISYEAVCTGSTGYAEVIKVRYDSAQISLQELLEVFFAIHDPTTLNRQGNDVGTQYRSGIYTTTDEQAQIARDAIAQLQAQGTAVVTEVQPLRNYWPAEEYHQDFFARNPGNPYCNFAAAPKLAKARKQFAHLLK